MGVARRKPVSADDLGSVDSLRRKESVMTVELIAHLESADEPLLVRRTGVLVWGDEERHAAGYVRDPCGYALLALAPGVQVWQRARILLQLLSVSWASMDPQPRATLNRVVRVLVLGLPATHVAAVLLALRHRRANHKHVTRAALRLLTEHPQAEELMGTHRRVLLAVVEHALGKATARGAARALIEGGVAEQGPGPDLHRRLLRFAPDGAVAMARIRALYQGAASPHQGQASPAVAVPELLDLDLGAARPGTVTATNRGDVAATLVHLYRGGQAADLESALDGYVDAAAARVASYPGTLALVLDRSASMRGYGDREWALYSQAVALRMVLQRRCTRLVEVPVGATVTGRAGQRTWRPGFSMRWRTGRTWSPSSATGTRTFTRAISPASWLRCRESGSPRLWCSVTAPSGTATTLPCAVRRPACHSGRSGTRRTSRR